jgi:outer membrane protein assembly factor BamB
MKAFFKTRVLFRITPILLIITLLTSCSLIAEPEFPGKAQIAAVIAEAAAYDSGRYLATNLDTGELEEVFSFMYLPDGRQIWLDEIETADAEGNIKSTYRYYDGAVITDETGKTEAAEYTRENPYDMSTGVLLFFLPRMVSGGTETVTPEGYTAYEQIYDVELMKRRAQGIDTTTAFRTTYLFDKDGQFLAMTEHITRDDGTVSNYQISLLDVNGVDSIIPSE